MEHPLRTLLYELFVEPVLRLLTWPTVLRPKAPAMNTEEHSTDLPAQRD
jgi:hypothetical protein